MRKNHVLGLGTLVAVLLAAGGVWAGNLTPPGPPGPTMYTLEDIYLAVTGDSNVVNTTSGDAIAGEILVGKKAWVQGHEVTGMMANVGQTNMTPGTAAQTVPQGYHDGTGSVAGDADLTASNILKGVVIFGVTGTVYNAAVPKTGQMATLPVNPAPAGSDGALQKGVAWPSPRFTDNSNGTVTDNLTGLVWLKNANAFGGRNWTNALTDCATLNSGEAGLSDGSVEGDWRLPNVQELQSLIDYGRYNPALCNTAGTGQWTSGDPFTGVQVGLYWSSSTHAGSSNNAWYVDQLGGGVNIANKNDVSGRYLWPVRDAQ